MRVAILNRPREWHPGGDLVSIDHRMAALRNLGVEVEYLSGECDLSRFDLVHIFHIDFPWCVPNFNAAIASGKPFVITPVFFPEHVSGGIGITGKSSVLHRAAAILPFSKREADELAWVFGPTLRYDPVPEGTSTDFHAPNGGDRTWVCASDWGGSKRSAVIEAACKLAELPHILFGSVPYAEMPAAYRKCRVFATASQSDRMSLAVGEALCSGCRVLGTSANRGNEWYPGLRVVDSASTVEQWAERLKAAYDSESWNWTPNVAARELTWDLCAERTKAVYERVLA